MGGTTPVFMWQDALEILLDGYVPANSIADSTHQFSTEEITSILSSHTGEMPHHKEIAETLERRGFKYMRTGDICMEWLFHKVSIQ